MKNTEKINALRIEMRETFNNILKNSSLEVFIPLDCDEGFGLSSLEYPRITRIWAESNTIYFKYEEDIVPFEQMTIEELGIILDTILSE